MSVSRKLIPPAVSFSKLRMPWRWARQPISPSRQPHARVARHGLVPQRDVEHGDGSGRPQRRDEERAGSGPGRAVRRGRLDQRDGVVKDVNVVRRGGGETAGGDRPDLHAGVARRDRDARSLDGGAAARGDRLAGAEGRCVPVRSTPASRAARAEPDGGAHVHHEKRTAPVRRVSLSHRTMGPGLPAARTPAAACARRRARSPSAGAGCSIGNRPRGPGTSDRPGEPAREWHAGACIDGQDARHRLSTGNAPSSDGRDRRPRASNSKRTFTPSRVWRGGRSRPVCGARGCPTVRARCPVPYPAGTPDRRGSSSSPGRPDTGPLNSSTVRYTPRRRRLSRAPSMPSSATSRPGSPLAPRGREQRPVRARPPVGRSGRRGPGRRPGASRTGAGGSSGPRPASRDAGRTEAAPDEAHACKRDHRVGS